MEKSISIIIPVYNSSHTLKECLDSIFSSTYRNFEIIIVNDCSADNSVLIAKKYICKIINLSEQRGPAFARNKGLSLAKGEIIAFLDADCVVPQDWLAKINVKLTPDIVGIGGRYILPKGINNISEVFMIYWDLKNIFYTKPRNLISLSGGNCAFWKSYLTRKRKRRELIYCDRSIGGDDTIMCYELSKFGKITYYPCISVIHNKKSTLFMILKATVGWGYSGAMVTGLCGRLLTKESHRLYKSILYLFSMCIFFFTFLLPVIPMRSAYF